MAYITSEKLLIPFARLSFPDLFKKGVYKNKETNYSGTFLFPKSDKKTYTAIINAIEEIKKEAGVTKLKAEKICLKDGNDDENDREEYKGMWVIKASNNKRPKVFNKAKEQVSEEQAEEEEILYAGCYVHAQIALWFQDNEFGKRINANLLVVKHVKDGEPFGGGNDGDVDAMDNIPDDDDDEY